MSGRERGAVLLKLADMMQANVDELGTLETLDGGFPITQSVNMHLADAIAVRACCSESNRLIIIAWLT